jgi:hypothetical protein
MYDFKKKKTKIEKKMNSATRSKKKKDREKGRRVNYLNLILIKF